MRWSRNLTTCSGRNVATCWGRNLTTCWGRNLTTCRGRNVAAVPCRFHTQVNTLESGTISVIETHGVEIEAVAMCVMLDQPSTHRCYRIDLPWCARPTMLYNRPTMVCSTNHGARPPMIYNRPTMVCSTNHGGLDLPWCARPTMLLNRPIMECSSNHCVLDQP
jgi:hypothetical protein